MQWRRRHHVPPHARPSALSSQARAAVGASHGASHRKSPVSAPTGVRRGPAEGRMFGGAGYGERRAAGPWLLLPAVLESVGILDDVLVWLEG